MDRKSQWWFLALCAMAGSLAAGPAATAQETAMTPSSHAAAARTPTPNPPFKVGVLDEDDGADVLQGCTTGLTRVGAASSMGDTFRESSADTDGDGFLRIDGKLVHVTLMSSSHKGRDVTLVFEDASHTLKVVESVKSGRTDEAADSTALTGTLTVTYKGATQTLRVEGGVAC